MRIIVLFLSFLTVLGCVETTKIDVNESYESYCSRYVRRIYTCRYYFGISVLTTSDQYTLMQQCEEANAEEFEVCNYENEFAYDMANTLEEMYDCLSCQEFYDFMSYMYEDSTTDAEFVGVCATQSDLEEVQELIEEEC
ncbi:MAG: hypothetical protein ABIA04_00400 [Pseudomonadota bacterium]